MKEFGVGRKADRGLVNLSLRIPMVVVTLMKSWRMDVRGTEERSLLRKQGKRQRNLEKVHVDG
jgi:hypothetical protein